LPTNTPDAPLSTSTDANGNGGENASQTPSPEPASPTPSGPQTHVVQAGEFLSTIAPQYGVTVEEILAANDITDPNVIFPGQELIIPEPGSVPPTTTAEPDDSNDEDDTTPTEEATANSG
jgi:LysM repeat protein